MGLDKDREKDIDRETHEEREKQRDRRAGLPACRCRIIHNVGVGCGLGRAWMRKEQRQAVLKLGGRKWRARVDWTLTRPGYKGDAGDCTPQSMPCGEAEGERERERERERGTHTHTHTRHTHTHTHVTYTHTQRTGRGRAVLRGEGQTDRQTDRQTERGSLSTKVSTEILEARRGDIVDGRAV